MSSAGLRTASRYAVGLTGITGEASFRIQQHGYVAASAKRAIIALHGHGSNALQFSPIGGWDGGKHVQNLAHNGYYVLSIDAGGGTTWENATSMAAVLAAYNYIVNTVGVSGTKVGLLGWSMGGGNALQFIKEQAAKVAGAYLFAPQSNLDHFYAINTYTAEINTAHGVVGGNYTTAAAGRRLAAEGFAPWQGGVPVHIAHGDVDTTVPLSLSQTFVASVGQASVGLSTIAGKDHSTVFSGVPVANTLAFFDGLTW